MLTPKSVMRRSGVGLGWWLVMLCLSLMLVRGMNGEYSALHDDSRLNSGASKSLRTAIRFYQWNALTERDIKSHYIKTLCLLFYNTEAPDAQNLIQDLESVATVFKKKDILHVYVASTKMHVFDFFLGDDAAEILPFVAIVEVASGFRQHRLLPPFDRASMEKFEADYFAGNLKPFLRSEDPLEEQEGEAVIQLVGSEFPTKVYQKKDVMLFLLAPWCGHCRKFEPRFLALAERMSHIRSIVFYKMDITKNDVDHPKLRVDRVPCVVLLAANDKNNPVVFKHASTDTVEYGVEFLEKHASIPFDLKAADELRERGLPYQTEGAFEL